MRQTIIIFILFALFAILMLGCASGRLSQSGDLITIAVKNETGHDIARFWIGSRGQYSLGSLQDGETSESIEVGSHTSEYRKSSFRLEDGTQYANVLRANDDISLTPGQYLFTVRMVGEDPVMFVTQGN